MERLGLMAKWGDCDFSELEKLQKQFEKLSKIDVDKFCQDVARELATRLLAKVIPRTPTGIGTFEVKEEKKSLHYFNFLRYNLKKGGIFR